MNTYFLLASRNMIFGSKQGFVQHQALAIATALRDAYGSFTVEDVSWTMEQLDIAQLTQIVITDDKGNILYNTSKSEMEFDFPLSNVMRALDGYNVFYARFSAGIFSSSAFTPVVSRGVTVGAVCVFDEDREQGEILLDMQSTMRNMSITIVVISIVAIVFMLWSVIRRITSILNAIESVREGEYNYRIGIQGSDELAILGDEFNSLTDRLRETDEVRRRFVADASHELRTPLASIRLLSDSILQNRDIERETVQEFIGDIGTEAERLARITEKLMSLTRLNSRIPYENKVVDMKDAVVATLRMLRPLAQSRGLELISALEENCFVFAMEDSIHQIIFNLIENAIKYNKPNGSVSVGLGLEGETVVLTVDDTGVSVPDADLPYIFDRFYRVDKARSREAGGSGLGLSIVWDAVREHNGKVTAEQREGGGMRFKVCFLLYKDGDHNNEISSPT